MSYAESETARIAAEYERREREIPADFYSWSNPANLLIHQQAVRSCVELLKRVAMFPLNGRRVADIGCGSGTWLLEFLQWGADDVSGIDLMPARIERARARLPHADIRQGSAAQLPWPDQSFDLVTQFMLFMNVFDPQLKREIANEMLRVLKRRGVILWFDLRIDNPRNSNARGIRAREIRGLFPGCDVQLKSAILAPPVARLIARWAWPLGETLHALPFLRTHYVGVIRKP
jgi:ubiquinone/menaquinone biosynthesis C-methylase UbiE